MSLLAGRISVTRREAEQVLRNWIAQALDPGGRLPDGVDPATFAAHNFIEWWQRQVADAASRIGDAFQDAFEAARQGHSARGIPEFELLESEERFNDAMTSLTLDPGAVE